MISVHIFFFLDRFSIFKADHFHHSIFKEPTDSTNKTSHKKEYYAKYVDLNIQNNCFSFTRFCDLSPKDMEDVTLNGLIT